MRRRREGILDAAVALDHVVAELAQDHVVVLAAGRSERLSGLTGGGMLKRPADLAELIHPLRQAVA